MKMDEYYSIQELAKIWKVSLGLVRREIKAGRLKYIRLGPGKKAVYRIYKGEIDRYMAEEYEKHVTMGK